MRYKVILPFKFPFIALFEIYKLSQSDTKSRPETGERLERSAGRGVRRRGRIFSGVESAETTGVPIGKTCQRLSSGCFFGSFLVNTRNERPRQGARPIPRQKPNFFRDFVRTVVGQASIMHPAFGSHIYSEDIFLRQNCSKFRFLHRQAEGSLPYRETFVDFMIP